MGVLHRPTCIIEGRRKRQRETAAALVFVALAEAGHDFDATTLAEHSELFEKWIAKITYSKGQIRKDETDRCLYRCMETHAADDGEAPPSKSELWDCICNPADEWPAWFPPIGAMDAWMSGDKCSHDSKKWICGVDNNVQEPGVYGWEEADTDGE